jgi:hypothetical protein
LFLISRIDCTQILDPRLVEIATDSSSSIQARPTQKSIMWIGADHLRQMSASCCMWSNVQCTGHLYQPTPEEKNHSAQSAHSTVTHLRPCIFARAPAALPRLHALLPHSPTVCSVGAQAFWLASWQILVLPCMHVHTPVYCSSLKAHRESWA